MLRRDGSIYYGTEKGKEAIKTYQLLSKTSEGR
jgi:hypothetical protein